MGLRGPRTPRAGNAPGAERERLPGYAGYTRIGMRT